MPNVNKKNYNGLTSFFIWFGVLYNPARNDSNANKNLKVQLIYPNENWS